MNETKKPAIRFQGFSDEWKQSRVGELIEDYTEKTVVQNQYPVLTSSQQQGIVRQEEYFADRQVTTNDNVGYFVLPFGYFTYRSRSDTDVFVFNRNDLINKGIISYYYPVFAPKNCDSNFLLRRLNYGIKKQLSMAAEGTGQKVLAHNKFKDMIVDVPDEEEQIKIGATLEYVDRLIAQHQSKLEKLQAFKASMLEKMFPKDGADVPEVRFSEFSGAWKQCKMDDLAIFNPKEDLPDKFEYVDLESVFGTEMLSHRTEFKETAPSRAQRLACIGDLFYQTVRPYQKNNYLFEKTDENYVFSTGYAQMRPFVDGYFLLSLVQNDRFVKVVLDNCTGTSYPAINANDLAKIEVFAPVNKQEAQKTGMFFRRLDNQIILRQHKIVKLQSIKKALLGKMFV